MADRDNVPREGFLRLLERHAARVPDPIQRLRFLRDAQTAYRRGIPLWWYSVQVGPPFRICGRRLPVSAFAAVSLAVFLALAPTTATRDTRVAQAGMAKSSEPVPVPGPPSVWMVEQTAQSELFSNGLRVEARFSTATRPRAYRAYAKKTLDMSEWRHQPAGIVYHTSESQMAPFESEHNASLKRNGAGLLEWVRQTECYHFLIDRFGRVHRIVAESDYANHAGNSVWADSDWVYINLNQSFLGVSFEAAHGRTEAGEPGAEAQGKAYNVNPAQIHAARILTEMLRSRYGIAAENCVTHAQVSVNPQKMAIGYHTDWAGDFPFRELGLENGYDRPLASMVVFGFTYDSSFLHAIGRQVWRGMLAADEQILRNAAESGVTPEDYRRSLQRKYRELAASLRAQGR